jgi:hypothetical protein
MKNKPNIKNDRNALVRKWIRENGAATFDFKNNSITILDGLLFSIEHKFGNIMEEDLCDYFDLKNQDVVLSDKKQ